MDYDAKVTVLSLDGRTFEFTLPLETRFTISLSVLIVSSITELQSAIATAAQPVGDYRLLDRQGYGVKEGTEGSPPQTIRDWVWPRTFAVSLFFQCQQGTIVLVLIASSVFLEPKREIPDPGYRLTCMSD